MTRQITERRKRDSAPITLRPAKPIDGKEASLTNEERIIRAQESVAADMRAHTVHLQRIENTLADIFEYLGKLGRAHVEIEKTMNTNSKRIDDHGRRLHQIEKHLKIDYK